MMHAINLMKKGGRCFTSGPERTVSRYRFGLLHIFGEISSQFCSHKKLLHHSMQRIISQEKVPDCQAEGKKGRRGTHGVSDSRSFLIRVSSGALGKYITHGLCGSQEQKRNCCLWAEE